MDFGPDGYAGSVNIKGIVVLLAAAVALAGCQPVDDTGSGSTGSGSGGGGGSNGSGLVVADGHGWTSDGLDGPMPAAGSCHIGKASDGEPLPDPKCTPGAVDSKVTASDISTTICRKGGYTTSVRPPESLTEPAKKKLLAAYGIPESKISDYELDHLIELNAGGASDLRNLWPEPNTLTEYKGSAFVHNDKDEVEEYTYHAICDGKASVTAVQKAVAANWTTAVSVLGLAPIPTDYQG